MYSFRVGHRTLPASLTALSISSSAAYSASACDRALAESGPPGINLPALTLALYSCCLFRFMSSNMMRYAGESLACASKDFFELRHNPQHSFGYAAELMLYRPVTVPHSNQQVPALP